MNRISRIAVDLPDSATLESYIRQTTALLDRYHQIEERNRRLFSALQDNAHQRLFSVLQDNARQIEERNRRLFSVLQDNAHQRLFSVLQDNARQIEERNRRLFSALQDNARKVEAVVDSARLTAMALQESPAMKAIREFSNTPFNPAVKEIVFNDLDRLEIEQSDISEYPDFDSDQSIQSEIQKELAGSRDYNRLSERAKLFLSSFFYIYLLPIFLNIVASVIMTYIQIVQTDLQNKETLAEIKSYVRKPILGVNKELLKNYRIVIGSDVHFRKGPSMKSEIITKLPRGKLIEVLDKSNRSWLRVEVDIGGETYVGWVSRCYTIYFK